MKNLNGEHRGDTYCFTKGNHRTVNHCIFIHWGSRLWINTHDDYSSQSMSTDSYTHVDWWLTAASAGLMDVIWFSQGIWIKHKHRFIYLMGSGWMCSFLKISKLHSKILTEVLLKCSSSLFWPISVRVRRLNPIIFYSNSTQIYILLFVHLLIYLLSRCKWSTIMQFQSSRSVIKLTRLFSQSPSYCGNKSTEQKQHKHRRKNHDQNHITPVSDGETFVFIAQNYSHF